MQETLTAAIQHIEKVNWLWLIPVLPFLGATINGIFGKKLQDAFGKKAVHFIAIGVMVGAAAVATAAFVKLLGLEPHERYLLDKVFPMIHVGRFQVDMAFAVDPLSGMMLMIITWIGTGIHIYSTGYMAEEPSYWRFFCYLNLFVFSMLLLVMGDSFIIMFFGWEGVGLCSYLLIGFWYKESKNATAGMKAFVVNRVGDWGFVTGLFLIFWSMGGVWSTLDSSTASLGQDVPPGGYYAEIGEKEVRVVAEPEGAGGEHAKPEHGGGEHGEEGHKPAAHSASETHENIKIAPTVVFRDLRNQLSITNARGERFVAQALQAREIWGLPLVFVICLCFFIGATGKSAQLPLYVWLPDAMAGPTPVSALIHAATMVTAGVYMIARLNFIFILSPGAMSVVATVGALTALFAATIGLFQYDIKKVLAYSTVSQLGFMFIGVGCGAYWAGAFHLLTHACFKACLFLGSGSVIHGMHALTHHREHEAHGHGDDDHGGGHGQHGHSTRDPRMEADPFDPQDMRNMGGLASLMPQTRLTYLIACLAIAGFPIAAGFYSKDEILWKVFASGSMVGIPFLGAILWGIGLMAATCTSFYMFRSYYMTFYGKPASAEHKAHVHESPLNITGVLWFLAIASIIVGPILGLPILWTHRPPLLEQWLEPVTNLTDHFLTGARAWKEDHTFEWIFMGVSVGVATLGWFLARSLYKDVAASQARLDAWKQQYAGLHSLIFDKYRVDELYQKTFVRGFQLAADGMSWFDANVVDYLVNVMGKISLGAAAIGGFIDRYFVDGAVNGVAWLFLESGRRARKVQTGRINNYVLGVVVGIVILVLVTSLV